MQSGLRPNGDPLQQVRHQLIGRCLSAKLEKITMFSLRLATRIVAAAALLGVALGEAGGQTTGNAAPPTPAEMAKAIANGIAANTQRTPGAALSFESATSHDNVVELRYLANDAGFARLKTNSEQVRLAKVSYYCKDSRLAFLKQGIVIHEVLTTAANTEQINFTFDKSSCDGLPKAALADPKTLAEFALTIAKTVNEAASNEAQEKSANGPFRLSGATAHQGVVDERFTVLASSATAMTPESRGKITAVVTGVFCTKYHDVIAQGLAFHNFFVLADQSPVMDFTVDRSNC
jgi:hypothetical protein